MTAEREQDMDATVKMPRPVIVVEDQLQDFDPEKTLVREDWERNRPSEGAPAAK
jgi:hypothetical protein